MTATGRATDTTTVRAAATVALWGAAHAGGLSPDAVLTVLRSAGLTAGVRADDGDAADRAAVPGPGQGAAPLAELLPLLRSGGPAALLRPVAGDMRGLPPASRLAAHGVDAGAAVVLPSAGLALVPDHGLVRVYCCETTAVAEPERDMRMRIDESLRTATAVLRRLDLVRGGGDPHGDIARAVAAAEVELPPGVPGSVADLLRMTVTIEAIVAVAASHGTAAATAAQLAAVDAALVPVAEVARQAYRTAVAVAVAALHPLADGHPPVRPARISR